MNVADWLSQTARCWPERMALYHGTEPLLRYRELALRSAALAQWLAEAHAVAQGDRVAIFARNCPEYLEILHAVWWLGAVVVPINHKLHPTETSWILENSGTKLVFTETGTSFTDYGLACAEASIRAADHASLSHAEPDAPIATSSDDAAWLFYTSGTTGRPKGVVLTHANLIQMTLCYGTDVDPVGVGDISLYAAPMSHGAGLYALPFIRAGAAHLVPRSRGFDPAEIIALAEGLGGLSFFAAPTMVKRLIKEAVDRGYRGDGIKTIIYGGGPMYAADINAALAQFGPRFVQIYGQGESPMTITALSRDLVADETHPAWRARRASVGIAQASVDVRILHNDGSPAATGETGEVAVRGPTVMKGYWNNPEATAKTIRDGWLLTGDLGHMDEDGFLTLTDRSKDVIISGGTNIYPREVEEVLLRHPAVFEVAVIGAPEPEWGEVVVAFVVRKPGTTTGRTELEAWCKDNMASFKKPKIYRFVDDLPKNSYGKILKTELRRTIS